MPGPLDIYRAWEREAPATVCHVMIIHAGDGSAAHRITLTDKPYRDSKGYNGSKYHYIYPAPVQAIIGDIVTDEQTDSTSYDNVTLANADGKVRDILEGVDVANRFFEVYRGDTRWSLLEENFPYIFIPVFSGIVQGVKYSAGLRTAELQIAPDSAGLERTVGSQDKPVAFGALFNVPCKLVDEATNRYRFSSDFPIDPKSSQHWDNYQIRDNGEPLSNSEGAFTTIEEDGEFRGLFELAVAAAGTVTAGIDYAERVHQSRPKDVAAAIACRYAYRQDMPNQVRDFPDTGQMLSFFIRNIDQSNKAYAIRWISSIPAVVVREYDINTTTGELEYNNVEADISGIYEDINDIDDFASSDAMAFDVDGEYLLFNSRHRIGSNTQNEIFKIPMTDAWGITTLDPQSATSATGFGSISMLRMGGDKRLYFPDGFGRIRRIAFTGEKVSSVDTDEQETVTDFNGYTALKQFDFYSDNKILYADVGICFAKCSAGRQIDSNPFVLSQGYFWPYAYDGQVSSFDGVQDTCAHSDSGRIYMITSNNKYAFFDVGTEPATLPIYYFQGGGSTSSRSGVYSAGNKTAGQLIRDAVSPITGMGYHLNRYGTVSLATLQGGRLFDISEGDLITRSGDSHSRLDLLHSRRNVRITYAPNLNTQPESTIAGNVSKSMAEAFATSEFRLAPEDPDENADDIEIETWHISSNIGQRPEQGNPSAVRSSWQSFYGADRYATTIMTHLAALPTDASCPPGVCRIRSRRMTIAGKLPFTNFRIIGLKRNWSKSVNEIKIRIV